MTIFDSSGIEDANRIMKQLKAYAKFKGFDDSYNPYKVAYASMPSHSSANPEIKQLYIDEHFCYAYKIEIVTNGLGIIRHITFLDDGFKQTHPEIPIEKKSGSPNHNKLIGNSSLKPVLSDFFALHPQFQPDTFLGDSAFDTIGAYRFIAKTSFLRNQLGRLTRFSVALIQSGNYS